MILVRRLDFDLRYRFLDRAERFHHQNRVMRDDGAAAFAHDLRMRDPFRIAHVHDVLHDVVRVFLQRIIGGAIELAARTIVIDAQSAADIEITELMPDLAQAWRNTAPLHAPRA